mmetsp:Transcript_4017/g.8831  ORF Transcript_4017/g.8831 Transcript_4017/m.8831 type:complete len:235 (-) Transcript_4017:315-1019(-)
MFHPSGPNFRRSCITAWNQHSEKHSFLNATSCLHSAKKSSLKAANEPVTFAFNPLGGSSVIFTAFCSTATGNFGDGIAVSHSRKSGCSTAGSKFSTSASILGIHETARWQFWRRSHAPVLDARVILRSAIGPCPCPSEIESSRSSKPISFANSIHDIVGSTPEESTKRSGTTEVASWNARGRLNVGGSMNLTSISAVTKAMMPHWIISWRRHRSTSSFCSRSSFSFHSPGSASL